MNNVETVHALLLKPISGGFKTTHTLRTASQVNASLTQGIKPPTKQQKIHGKYKIHNYVDFIHYI